LQFEISYGRESYGKRKSFCGGSTWQIYSGDSDVGCKYNDSCILGIDFLKKIHLENIFKSTFSKQKEIQSSRLESFLDVSSNLKYLFEES